MGSGCSAAPASSSPPRCLFLGMLLSRCSYSSCCDFKWTYSSFPCSVDTTSLLNTSVCSYSVDSRCANSPVSMAAWIPNAHLSRRALGFYEFLHASVHVDRGVLDDALLQERLALSPKWSLRTWPPIAVLRGDV